MATCMIVEDEPISQELLQSYIEQVPELELVVTCNNAIEAGEQLRKRPVDLLFLDINMPKMTGTAFYSSLVNPPSVIFTTAYPEFAVEGFDLNAVDYLVKPFAIERFMKAVNKYFQQKPSGKASYILVQVDKKTHKVDLSGISYIEAFGDYVKIQVKGNTLVVHQTLSRMEEQLPSVDFRRIHKSFIISLRQLSHIDGNIAQVGEHEIPIGQTYRTGFLEHLAGKILGRTNKKS
jgi:DNA-binding LytR/AlgR family response regulator